MRGSTRQIEDWVDTYNIKGAEELTQEQRDIVVAEFINEKPVHDILDSIKPKELSFLMSQLHNTEKYTDIINVATKLKQATSGALSSYFDQEIDGVISQYRHEMHKSQLEQIPKSYARRF